MRRSHHSPAVALVLGSTLAMGLAACGSSTESTGPSQGPDVSSPVSTSSQMGEPVGESEIAPTVVENAASTPAVVPPALPDVAVEVAGDVSSPSPVEPSDVDDRDETPPAGEVPLDVVPLTDLGAAPEMSPTVEIAPYRVSMSQPEAVPVDVGGFASVSLRPADDLLPGGADSGGSDGLVLAAATGCADHCIESATISTAGGTSSWYDLRVDVESPATVEAYLSLTPIQRNDDGRYVRPSSVPTASQTVGFGWSTAFDLDPETEYHLLVRAIDEQGTSEVAGTFTTAAAMGPDELALPMPCADGCLDWIDTIVGDDGTEVGFTVSAEVDVTLDVAWSLDPFVQTDTGPVLENATVETFDLDAGVLHTNRLLERPSNTAHYVSVTATDAFGGVDRMVAAIATTSPTIRAGIDRVHVRGDGDDGRRDRGEIRFLWGDLRTVGISQFWGNRGEAKIPSNTTIRLGRDAARAIDADGSGRYPAIALYAGERDGNRLLDCFIAADGDWRPADTVSWCGRERVTWSNTYVPQMTLAEIEQLSTCEPFDVDNVDADRCAWVHTPPNSSDQVSFDMVVWFDID